MISLEKLLTMPKNPLAGIVIDMQMHFIQKHSSLRIKEIKKAQIRMIRYFASQSIPVLVLEYRGNGDTIKELKDVISTVPYHTCLREYERYFTKSDDDGFTNPMLLEILEALGSEHLVLMGVNASSCVRRTAQSAKGNGFYVSSSEDLISDCKPDINPKVWYERNCRYYTRTAEDLILKLKG